MFPRPPVFQRTLAIIKPDAIAAGHEAQILKAIAEAGLKVANSWSQTRDLEETSKFYEEHQHR